MLITHVATDKENKIFQILLNYFLPSERNYEDSRLQILLIYFVYGR